MEEQNVETMRINLKQMWNTWDIRSFMVVSLLIQVLLTFLAPLRKRTSSSILSFYIWLLYLSADAVALYTIGLISSNSSPKDSKKVDLLAFWAPFLLLHLGGPDTITALALADNELWHRHALSLMTQIAITFYVFYRSLSKYFNHLLWIPTVLMFIDGFTKYIERTCALYYASVDSFRDSLRPKPEAGPNYARLVEEFSSASSAHIPMKIQGKDGPSEGTSDSRVTQHRATADGPPSDGPPADGEQSSLVEEVPGKISSHESDEIVVKVTTAYQYYNKFKGLLVDAILSLKDKEQSRKYFLEKEPIEFANIILTELHIMYDVFYTKVFLIRKKLQYVRLVCFLSVIASLLLFSLEDKSNFNDVKPVDVAITFILLGGAITLDICSAVMFILSDWWIVIISNNERHEKIRLLMIYVFKWTRWARTLHCCQWERSMSSYNLLECFFKEPPSFLEYISIKRIRDIVVGWLYAHSNKIDDELIKFIIEELQMKAKKAIDQLSTNQVCSARGNLVLQEDYFLVSECLSPWTTDVDYDESLLTWHLATDICYRTSESNGKAKHREFSMKLSNYMSYLLLRQEAFMSPVVGISDIRYEDTRAEARKFCKREMQYSWFKNVVFKCISSTNNSQHYRHQEKSYEDFLKYFCEEVRLVKSVVKPLIAKGDKSKSVLFDACRLAKQLDMFKEKQWEITSKVWVELLTYAAIRVAPKSHLARLNQGGELISMVWLSMAHLGLGERFRQNQGFGWTKLVLED